MAMSWSEISSGIYGQPELSKQARHLAPKMSRFMEAVDPSKDFYVGKKSGQSIGYQITGRLSDLATSPILEHQKIPLVSPTEYVGTATVYRYGLAIPFTGLRKDLDRLDPESKIIRLLRDNATRTTNKLIYDKAVAGRSMTYVPLTSSTQHVSATAAPSGTRAANLTLYHLQKIALAMTENNAPPFDGENYLGILSPKDWYGILGDAGTNGFIDVAKYKSSGAEGVLNNELGKLGGSRFLCDNDAIANAIGTSSAYGSSLFFGWEAIKEVPVYPMHFRAQMNLGQDFGNQAAIAFQMLMTWSVPWNLTTHGQGSILHVTTG